MMMDKKKFDRLRLDAEIARAELLTCQAWLQDASHAHAAKLHRVYAIGVGTHGVALRDLARWDPAALRHAGVRPGDVADAVASDAGLADLKQRVATVSAAASAKATLGARLAEFVRTTQPEWAKQ